MPMNDKDKNEAIVAELTRSYWMELETVLNYLANSTNLDGVRAEDKKITRGRCSGGIDTRVR